MKRYRILLTENQLQHVTTALYEWAGLCESEATDVFGKYRPKSVLVKAAKDMEKVSRSIYRQVNKQKLFTAPKE